MRELEKRCERDKCTLKIWGKKRKMGAQEGEGVTEGAEEYMTR